jgi:hypothetical protein
MIMRNTYLKAALIAAAILFTGAAAVAAADEPVASDASAVSSRNIEETSREQARRANEAAVEEAVEAVEADARLELDIKLIGHISVLIAGDV